MEGDGERDAHVETSAVPTDEKLGERERKTMTLRDQENLSERERVNEIRDWEQERERERETVCM